jgi:DDE family transposase
MHPFDREVCRRLPLADAVFRLLDFALADDFLGDVFDRYRGRSYQDTLSFPCFVQLIADALLGQERSAHRPFQHAQDQGTLPTGVEAVYGKLRRVPLPLSQGLLCEATARLRQVFPDAHDPLPASLDDFEVYAFDGKKIKHVAKRLKALWRLNGQVLGGKLLVVQHTVTGLAVALAAHADGEADERPLVATALAQVRQQGGDKPRLWIGDRLFCDRNQLPSLQEGGDHYLVRHQARFHFHTDPTRPAQTGVDGRGVPYTQEWGWLGAEGQPRRLPVRRITLHRGAAATLAVVTDLLDEAAYPAADLLEAYLRRWGIEKLFQRVTEVFDLRHLIGTAPQATIFQASFCFVLSNVIGVVRNYLAEAQQRLPETISTPLLFEDILEELTAWHKFLTPMQTQAWLEDGVQTAAQVMAYLRRRLAGVWNKRWLKAATKKRCPAGKREYLKGGHSSVYRIQRGLHEIRDDYKKDST